jgi:hypothetical protein
MPCKTLCDTLRTDDETGDECVHCGMVYEDVAPPRPLGPVQESAAPRLPLPPWSGPESAGVPTQAKRKQPMPRKCPKEYKIDDHVPAGWKVHHMRVVAEGVAEARRARIAQINLRKIKASRSQKTTSGRLS